MEGVAPELQVSWPRQLHALPRSEKRKTVPGEPIKERTHMKKSFVLFAAFLLVLAAGTAGAKTLDWHGTLDIDLGARAAPPAPARFPPPTRTPSARSRRSGSRARWERAR